MAHNDNNGFMRKVQILLVIISMTGAGFIAYADVKNNSKTNKENIHQNAKEIKELKKEMQQEIKEINQKQTTMLIQQAKILTVLEKKLE